MGCCKQNSVLSGFLLPEQEQGIAQIEKTHPFARIDADLLFHALCVKGVSGEIKEHDFFSACKRLLIPAEDFYRIDSQFSPYFYELKKDNGLIDLQTLFLSGILVCNSDWELKLKMILLVFDLNGKEIAMNEITEIFELMVYVSTSVLPRITIDNVPQRAIEFYINRLVNVKPLLIKNMTAFFSHKDSFTEAELFKVFSEYPELQKVFWSNGVRMMLIEEDNRQAVLEQENAFLQKATVQTDDLNKSQHLEVGDIPGESESTNKYSLE